MNPQTKKAVCPYVKVRAAYAVCPPSHMAGRQGKPRVDVAGLLSRRRCSFRQIEDVQGWADQLGVAGTWLLVTECVLGLSHAHLLLLDQNANPAFGVTQVAKLKKKTRKRLTDDLVKFQVMPAKDDVVGRVLHTKLLAWKRYRAPDAPPAEWSESKVDPFCFQFHVPPPRMVYRDHIEVRFPCALRFG